MITGISVRNFKSLVNFKLDDLAKFSCLIGLNGSGKTTVLQLFDFLGNLALGSIKMRGWDMAELVTAGRPKMIVFTVDVLVDTVPLRWSGTYNVDKERVENEQIAIMNRVSHENEYRLVEESKLLEVRLNGSLSMQCEGKPLERDIRFLNYQGSFLPFLNKGDAPLVDDIKKELESLKSLELLNPASLRRPSQENTELGIGGDGLPGFLSQLTAEDSVTLLDSLKQFYPRLQAVEVKRRQYGWKNLLIKEYQRTIRSGHINDGLLRILAILSQRYTTKGFLLFDEIENGVNQEIIQKLVTLLQDFNGKQVMVTTHSALVLNYLTDSVAKESIILLYQDEKGHTQAVKFFDIPEIANMLEFMGPGQVMSQTNLVELATKLCQKNEKGLGSEG